ncbi:hypothetical protein AZE42_06975 [Rhizopogon vesiculosus]|uniref:Uncharacterized protein n=1 Tax=Rhizopogon vesiculosus TaxID=180088 RepID=A0A1J8R4I4_9AGAM|nr:hypothetical protein AZE42_06975 [Rhizopogon vesiculosus]
MSLAMQYPESPIGIMDALKKDAEQLIAVKKKVADANIMLEDLWSELRLMHEHKRDAARAVALEIVLEQVEFIMIQLEYEVDLAEEEYNRRKDDLVERMYETSQAALKEMVADIDPLPSSCIISLASSAFSK